MNKNLSIRTRDINQTASPSSPISAPFLTRNWRPLLTFLATLAILFAINLILQTVEAANPDGDLRIEIITAYNLVVDSNVETPATYAPEAFHIGVQFCNDGTNDLTDVVAHVGNFSNNTPGIYPARQSGDGASSVDPVDTSRTFDEAHPHLAGTPGSYSFTHEGSTADASRIISTLPAGECASQYWLVSYPRRGNLNETGDNLGDAVWGETRLNYDDLWLAYDVWATAKDGASTLSANETRTAIMRNEISAMANKIWPNGDNKVPDVYKQAIEETLGWATNLESGNNAAYPGELIHLEGIWYDLGNVGHGFDNDGDFVPDKNAWMQPVGDPALYNPGCFRLVHTYGIVIVKLVEGGEYLIPFEDQLYFEHIPDNTGAVGLVFYDYLVLNGPCQANISPYQEVASGYENEKFNGDYGHYTPPLIALAPAVELDKTVDQVRISLPPATTLNYTLTITNTSPMTVGNPALGVPLVIQESIPAALTYVTGSADDNVNIDGGTISASILYSTDDGTSWTVTEPASDVTNIQWWLDAKLPPGATGSVTFQINVPSTYTDTMVLNTAGLSFGSGDPIVEDSASTFIEGDNAIAGTVFEDDGAGSHFANGGYDDADAEEVGILGMTVTLYLSTTDGLVLWETDVTDGNGDYSFTLLPDGDYVIVTSTDLPASNDGWTNTTEIEINVNGLSGGTTSSDNDFGFAPALTLDKTLNGGGPVYEGQEVIYPIKVSNELPGDGSGDAASCTYYTWAATEDATNTGSGPKVWGNPANAFAANGPDSSYANADYQQGSNNLIAGTSYSISDPGSTITKVEAIFQVYLDQALGDDGAIAELFFNNTSLGTNTFTTAEMNAFVGLSNAGLLAWDVTSLSQPSTWADFAGDLDLALEAQKNTNADPGFLYLDAIGFRVTTDETCGGEFSTTINPVPLTDTYDPTKLQFVSADPPVSSSSPLGTLTWDNVGPLYGGGSETVLVTFKALEPTGNIAEPITNTAQISNAFYVNGLPANDAQDDALYTLEPTGSITGVLWSDVDGDGWQGSMGYEGSDFRIAGVTVTLYSCTSVGGGGSCSGTEESYTTISDENGNYSFEGLPPSLFYRVSVDPASLPDSTPNQTGDPDDDPSNGSGNGGTCGSGGGNAACDDQWDNNGDWFELSVDTWGGESWDVTEINFGYDVPPAIYGNVWQDSDGDGTQESGEDGMSGVTVTLHDCGPNGSCGDGDDGADQTTTTDSDGNYSFEELTAGQTYEIEVSTGTLPGSDPWSETAETDGSTNNQITVTPNAGEISGSHDFGFTQTGTSSIGDTLFYDWDGDGTEDSGDEGIPNVTVYLYQDADGDGNYDADTDALVATDVTDADGIYLFDNLPAGDYVVVVDEDDSDFPTSTTQSGDPDESGTCSTCNGEGSVLGLPTSTTTDTIDFGYDPYGTGSLGDTVWFDQNGDGSQSGVLETGLASVTVELWADLNNDGTYTLVMSTTTDANGEYLFDNLIDGEYQVIVEATDTDIPDDAFGNNYVPTTSTTYDAVISAGEVTSLNGNACSDCNLAADFGFTALGAIGDLVFWDANGNGEADWNEDGIAGVDVTLTNSSVITTSDGIGWAVGTYQITTSTSDGSDGNPVGSYLFEGLPPGDYTVSTETTGPINSAAQTADPDRDGVTCSDTTYPSMPACDNATTVTILYGTNFMGADFGYQAPGAFGDYVWFDQDGDGVQDTTEIGITNLVVTATTTADVTIDGINYPSGTTITTTTDFDGYYSFDNLISNGSSATWSVTVEQPANMAATYDPDGTLNNSTTVVIDTSGTVTAVGGSACSDCFLDVDFGFELSGPYSLSGTLCLDDPTEDGVCTTPASEVELDGIDLFIVNSNGDFIAQVKTDASGAYTVTNLPEDTYYVAMSTVLAPLDTSDLTTDATDTPATSITNNMATTQVVYQSVIVNAANASGDGGSDANQVEGIDFAYVLNVELDFGDLPEIYNTTLSSNPDGARHIIPATPDLYLGTAPQAEPDGDPDTAANTDENEDGVTPVNLANWADGTVGSGNGGEVQVSVTGDGWLVGWIDFNNDGDFTDAGEMIVSQAASSGTTNLTFDIPNGTLNGGDAELYARFRLFGEEPTIPSLSFSGLADNGEVEDYRWNTDSASGTIGNLVWHDADGDGVYDIGEPGLPNVGVSLYDAGPDGQVGGGDDTLIGTTTTDVNGNYLFTDVPPGDYYVDVTDGDIPSGLTESPSTTDPSSVVTLASGDTNLDVDFGYTNDDSSNTAIIGDFIWSDANGDGMQDPAEAGISGVTVALLSAGADGILGTADDVTEGTTTTTADGSYLFTGVTPGSYIIDVTDTGNVLTGYTLTSGAQSSNDPTTPITVIAGDSYLNADFGYQDASLHTISDTVWHDANGDGNQDVGENGIAGVTINLLDNNGDIIATTTTDENGDFSFDGLPDGNYTIELADNTNLLSDFSGTTTDATNGNRSLTVSGADVTGTNFGLNIPGAIGNTVFSDADGDGVQDAGELGISGVTVELWLDDGDGIFDDTVDTLVSTTTTEADGSYLFSGLAAGTYFANVDESQGALTGYSLTTTDDETGGNAAGTQIEVTLAAGESNLDADFGYQKSSLADISGSVWNDLDEDATDAGEPQIEGVTVVLVDSNGNVIATTTSDANGDYSFSDVPNGDYTLTVTDDDGVLVGYQLTSGLSQYPVTVTGSDITALNFGYVHDPEIGSIGDFVWLDADRDGTQDAAEGGIAGVTVTLHDLGADGAIGGGDDTLLASTTSDANGGYVFDDLPAGNYTVDLDGATLPTGLSATTGTGDNSGVINLSEGEDYNNADFGYASTTGSAMGDRVWYDDDGDGVQDPGEVGISGVNITVTGPSGTFNVTTADDGSWLVPALTPGDYTVTVDTTTLPAGYNTIPTNGDVSRLYIVPSGVDVMYADFGFDGGTTGSIGDSIFFDEDGDGAQGGSEPGIGGVTINLLDSGSNVIATTTSDENGNYDFTGLPAGDYQVEVTDIDGILDGLTLSNGSNPTSTIVLNAGEDYNDADFPYTPSGGSIGNLVWHDLNGDGDVDAGESGMQGVTVDLWLDVNNDGVINPSIDNFLRTVTTDENGEYAFIGLLAGNYLVDVTDTNGVTSGMSLTSGTANTDNNSQSDPYAVTLTSGSESDMTADFGYQAITPYTISGSTFNDLTNDGTHQEGASGTVEPTLANVSVYLYLDLNGDGVLDSNDPLIDTTTSDANGDYTFTDLPNGNYLVVTEAPQTLPSGMFQTTQTSSNAIQPVTINNANVTEQDFGFYAPTTISNFVWSDDDADGIQDGGEGGISGVVVNLYQVGGGFVISTTTNASGVYTFTGLAASDYVVDFELPTGYTFASQGVGGDVTVDSDPDSSTGETANLTVATGQANLDQDAGLISNLDYGDLPTSYNTTTLGNDGARQTVGSLLLGTLVDTDGDGAPTGDATGDDTDGTNDDDGVVHTPGVAWQTGTDGGSIDVTVTGGSGFVSAWIDWNQDGDFGDTGEQILVDASVSAGNNTLTFDVPAGATFTGTYNLRVRLYQNSGAGNSPTGYGGIGEVEDYQWNATPLSVELAAFEATCQDNQILVNWHTVSELDNLGFNLYRNTSADGPSEQLNSQLIASQAPGSGQGSSYQWTNDNVEMGSTYYYWLEDVSLSGITTQHGPVSVTCIPTAVTLQSLNTQPTPVNFPLALVGLVLLTGVALIWRRQPA